MSKDAQPGLEDVAALILERQRIENWLATLEARRASTPDNVYDRVQGDYSTRLKAITDQLIARNAALRSHVEQLTARITQIEAEAKKFREVRAELELRMQVGELGVADWNVKARECDEGIARLTEAQAQARGQLAQAREILAMVSGQTNGVPRRTPPVTPMRTSRPVSADQIRQAEISGNGSGRQRAVPDGAGMNELEFLNSVVGGEQSPAAPNDEAGQGATNPNVEADGAPDLAESLVSRVNQRNQAGKLREDGDAESLLKGVGVPKPGNKTNPLAANVTESNPIVLQPQGGPERHKTLKCQECGTMNYPTEWYCERCGAELVSV
jgi:hypothetical protein